MDGKDNSRGPARNATTAGGWAMRREAARRLRQLIEDMEGEGYMVSVDARGTGWHIRFPDRPPPEFCSMMRLNAARKADPALNAVLLPWLKRNRPYARLVRQLEQR